MVDRKKEHLVAIAPALAGINDVENLSGQSHHPVNGSAPARLNLDANFELPHRTWLDQQHAGLIS